MSRIIVSVLLALLSGCGGPTAKWEAQLKSGAPTERVAAAKALADMGAAAAPAIPSLSAALEDSETDVRRQAAHALGSIGKEALPVVPKLRALLSDGQLPIRLAAAYSIIALAPDDSDAIQVLAESARAGDPRAMITLRQLGASAREALPALLEASHNRSPIVRSKAVEALRRIAPNDERVTAALQQARNDPAEQVRAAADQK